MSQLETITGNLLKAKEFEKLYTSAELTNERRTNEELRNKWFYTSNFAMYTVVDDEVILDFGGREANPILNNIDEACKQLVEDGNYIASSEEQKAVFESREKTTLSIKYSELDLIVDDKNDEYGYYTIDTSNPYALKEDNLSFSKKIFSITNEDYKKNMKMFAEAGIEKIQVYVLNENYVKNNAEKDSSLVRGCWLGNFSSDSSFDAVGRSVDGYNCLFGVPIKVAEGDTQKNYNINQILKETENTEDFAPKQIKLLTNILKNNNYQIIKKE